MNDTYFSFHAEMTNDLVLHPGSEKQRRDSEQCLYVVPYYSLHHMLW